MKKTLNLLILLAIFVAQITDVKAQDASQSTEEFKPSGKPVVLIFANVHNTFSDGKNLTAFEVNRGFFGYDYSFSRNFSAKFFYDATAQTVNGSVLLQGYLRNAYLQYSNDKITLRGGLITPEQMVMYEKLWNYRYVARPFIEGTGMTFAADLGVSFKYKVSDMAAFDFSVTNGKGQKDIAADSAFRYEAGVTLIPVKNFLFRGYTDLMNKNSNVQFTLGLSGAYIGPKFSLGAEYIYQKNHSNISGHDYNGLSFYSTVKLNQKFSLFGRFDDVNSVTPDGATDPWNISKDGSTVYFGLDFNPVKGVRIAPNLIYYVPEGNGTAGTGIIGLNFEARF
jgi:hypothetical protein